MPRELRFQDPGEGIHEAEVVELAVAPGDTVTEGDTLLAVETDKATTDLPSPWSGTVDAIAVGVGDRIEVGDLILSFSGDGDQAEPEGREPERDSDRPRSPHERERPVPASPSTRRVARELGVNLHDVTPSGPAGRVLKSDVEAAAGGEPKPSEEGTSAQGKARPAGAEREQPQAEPRPADREEHVPLRSVRRAIAHQVTRAWREIPHVMHHELADITELERFRRARAEQVEQAGGHLTLTPLVMKALASALHAHPRFNARLDRDGESIVLLHQVHIGVAVDTERGLLVPVVRDVDRKGLIELAVELTRLAEGARAGELDREALSGGTFSLTNVGPLGGTLFTPIIRHPEAAILGLGRAEPRPVAFGGLDDPRVEVRLMLPLCLAFDHRLNDGADAARFASRLASSLRDPESLLLAS